MLASGAARGWNSDFVRTERPTICAWSPRAAAGRLVDEVPRHLPPARETRGRARPRCSALDQPCAPWPWESCLRLSRVCGSGVAALAPHCRAMTPVRALGLRTSLGRWSLGQTAVLTEHAGIWLFRESSR